VSADLSSIQPGRLARMHAASDALFSVLEDAARIGRPPMSDLLDGQTLIEWDHYPEGDIYDAATGIQVFYHAHAQGDRPSAENGHFHCFVERQRLQRAGRPIAHPKRDGSRELCHVVGISIDPRGVPFELFTTNQWVTDEWLYPADKVASLLPAFSQLAADAPAALRWVAALVTLFEPQIDDLLRERDSQLDLGRHGVRRRLMKGPLEVTSARTIDIDAQIDWVGAAGSA
jgi:hypothetical protein